MKTATEAQLEDFFLSLEASFDVRVPLRLPDGTRGLGRPGDGPLALHGGALPRKPTEVFFPQHDPMLSIGKDGQCETLASARPLLVAGFTAADLDCLEFVDAFFSRGYSDDLYLSKRKSALVLGISGRCGPGGSMLRIAGGKSDVEMLADEGVFLLMPHTEAGRKLLEGLAFTETQRDISALQTASDNLSTEERQLLEQASNLLLNNKIPDAFWQTIAERCIACTGCNLVCPTCTCYGVKDWQNQNGTERIRIWDSCQLEGFKREAGGHNPLGTEALRTRRRIHHKLAADLRRHGVISCFLCGRCDAACPTGIGMLSVTRELVDRYGRICLTLWGIATTLILHGSV